MKKQFFSLALFAAAWLAGGSAQAWDEPAQVDGVYQIGTASELEWFSEFVARNSNGETKAVLTADLDFTGVTHTPIGPNKDAKFNGSFDGQYHHIKNLVINTTDNYQGIFGWVRGGSTIKNLTIDATCSFTGGDRTAALVATLNANAGTDSPMQILNVVNHANVNSASGAVSAFIGASDNAVFFKIHNCVNTGNIKTTGSGKYAVVANGWSNGNPGANSQVWNVVNTGTISPIDGNNTFFRGNYRSVQNSYDVINYGMQATYISPSAIHSGELCYILNQGETLGVQYTQDLSDPNSIPMPISGLTVCKNTDYYCGGTAKGSYTYSNTELTASDVPASHSFSNETGLCTFCSYPKEDWKSASNDGYYYLSNATDVEWFSHMVRDAGHGAMNAKLDADIDFGGVPNAHLPIGSSGKKYFGHFDGQGHRIIGMVLNTASKLNNRGYDGNGFFGSVRGGGTDANETVTNEVIIENIIIDASCSIEHDNNFAAGVVAHINSRNDENSNIIIRNCGNEANVTTTGKNAAGILGCVEGTNVGLKLYNLWNKGNIVGRSGESAAICAWTGQRNVDGEVDVEGCWNIGEVTGIDGNHYNMIRRNSNIVPRNIVDLCIANGTNGGNQGTVAVHNTDNPISSGELCYLLNGDQTNIVYTQTLGTDAMPVYGTASSQVYQVGTIDCTGAAVGDINYSNTEGESVQRPHNYSEYGICSVCNGFEEPNLVDGWYELQNAGNVEWFGDYVDAGNLTSNAKLMNDIDFNNVENLHKPIGRSEQQKFNGTFDGQGYRIKNMIIEKPSDSNVGFFGWLRGNNANTTVKNLIIDSSCTIHGYNRVGGITGTYQNGGNIITIENVVNEATVTAEHQDAGGIFGGHQAGGPTIIIKNVMNRGAITAKNEHGFAGALCCYMEVGGGSKIENFVNLGTISGHEGGNIGRHNIGDVTNLIDLSATTDKTQGVRADLITTDIAGGKLAYTVGWWQELGTDDYPMPFEKVGAVVYRTGEERCDHADIATTVYSNTNGAIVTGSHNYNTTTGLCDLCSQPNAGFKSLVNGAYELGSVIDVKWFEAMVNYGSPAINGKVTTATLDFNGGSCRIGNDANSYRGTFQGNGVVVSNFVINNDQQVQGFFGWVTGGADISGIVFDNTCSISCNERGGIIGAAKDGGTVKITRLGNEGTVTTTSKNAAGIIGTDLNSACTLLIDQCYSTGTITGGNESAQIAGWTGANSKITNSWSCAEVTGVQEGREFSRYGGDNHGAQYENCFTTYHETNTGLTYDTPAAKFASGEVAYTINKNAGEEIFYQLLGTDDHPSLDSSRGQVILNGNYENVATTLTLNDANSFGTNSDFDVNSVTMTRTLKGEKWNTFCVPFGMTSEEISAQFGADAKVKELSGATLNGENYNMTFSDASTIVAGKPYMVRVSNEVTSLNLGAKTIKGTITPATAGDVTFTGVYNNGNAPQGSFIISNNVFYNVDSTVALKAFRGYITVDSGSGVKALTFDFDDDATGISLMEDGRSQMEDGAIYNVAGQRINKMQKGINIVNGKKILK